MSNQVLLAFIVLSVLIFGVIALLFKFAMDSEIKKQRNQSRKKTE